jgi:hypothetical protein
MRVLAARQLTRDEILRRMPADTGKEGARTRKRTAGRPTESELEILAVS